MSGGGTKRLKSWSRSSSSEESHVGEYSNASHQEFRRTKRAKQTELLGNRKGLQPSPGLQRSYNPAAITACQLWIATHHPRIFPSEHIISGLAIAFDASFDSLLQWFQNQSWDEDSGYQTIETRINESAAQCEINQHKCTRRANKNSRDMRNTERYEARPFACTSRCGQTFKTKDDWRRHEENNFPQRIWRCPVPNCQQSAFPRKEHFKGHLTKQHKYKTITSQCFEDNCSRVESRFDRRCILRKCNTTFRSWKARFDHIAQHLGEPWKSSDWRDVEGNTSSIEVEGNNEPHVIERDHSDSDESGSGDSSDESGFQRWAR